jgi:choline-sulfatase
MLGERGLWLKKTFFEPATRVPLIVHAPHHLDAGRCETLCSLVDLLPTFAAFGSDGAWDGAVEPLDGADLSTLAATGTDKTRAIHAELLCEGITSPIFMTRRGPHKFITGSGDPDMLFDVEADPDERHNLAERDDHAETVQAFAAETARLWDGEALAMDIRRSQQRRLLIRKAHMQGIAPNWDFGAGGEDDGRWYRGIGNYNDWAFDYLAPPET